MMMGGPPPSDASRATMILARLMNYGHVATERGGFYPKTITPDSDTLSSYNLSSWELGWRVHSQTDHSDDIHLRLAQANPTDMLFADFIGA